MKSQLEDKDFSFHHFHFGFLSQIFQMLLHVYCFYWSKFLIEKLFFFILSFSIRLQCMSISGTDLFSSPPHSPFNYTKGDGLQLSIVFACLLCIFFFISSFFDACQFFSSICCLWNCLLFFLFCFGCGTEAVVRISFPKMIFCSWLDYKDLFFNINVYIYIFVLLLKAFHRFYVSFVFHW